MMRSTDDLPGARATPRVLVVAFVVALVLVLGITSHFARRAMADAGVSDVPVFVDHDGAPAPR